MTSQIADNLVNLHPRVKTDGLLLYGVVRGDPRESPTDWGDGPAHAAKPTLPKDSIRCSALWRGHVATFVLRPDGRLGLAFFEYVLSPGRPTQEIDERLGGDFWLVMKPHFRGDRTCIPFHEGVIIEDRECWFIEESRLAQIDSRPRYGRDGPADDYPASADLGFI